MKTPTNNLTPEALTKLRKNIYNSLINTFYAIGESIHLYFKEGLFNLPDIAHEEFYNYNFIKSFQETFELLGVSTQFPESECDHRYYSLRWTDAYYLLREDEKAQWRVCERMIIQKNLPLAKDLIAFQKERKNNEQDPIL